MVNILGSARKEALTRCVCDINLNQSDVNSD